MCLNWMISLVSCGIGDVLSLLRICLKDSFPYRPSNSSAKVALLTSWSSTTQSGILQILLRSSETSELSVICDFTVSTRDSTLLSMYWICVETSHWCSPLLSHQQSSLRLNCSSRHLIRELQLVYLNLLTIIWMFCTITSLVVLYTESSVDFCVPLMTSSS